jgi:hypothetical protein
MKVEGEALCRGDIVTLIAAAESELAVHEVTQGQKEISCFNYMCCSDCVAFRMDLIK